MFSNIASDAGTSSGNSCQLTRGPGRPTLPSVDTIGTKIRAKRGELGLTLGQLSQRCGVDQGTISRIENGKKPDVAFRVLGRVTAALGLDLNELNPAPRELALVS